MVVEISLIAVACSRAPVACWLAAACSSADELCTCPMAAPIWRDSEIVRRKASRVATSTAHPPIAIIDRIAVVADAVDAVIPSCNRRFSCSTKLSTPRVRATRLGVTCSVNVRAIASSGVPEARWDETRSTTA